MHFISSGNISILCLLMHVKKDIKLACALAGTLILWGSAFPAIRATLNSYSPGHLALLRLSIAAVTLLVFGIIRGMRLPAWRDLPGIATLGITGISLYHLGLNYGEVTVSAGAAGFIIGSTPIWATLFSVILLRERPGLLVWLGIIISFGGIALISISENGSGTEAASAGIMSSGAVCVLLAAVAGGLYCTLQKPLLQKYTALELTAYSMLIGALLLTWYIPGLAGVIRRAPLEATLSIVYLGVFPAACAYVAWAYILSQMTVSRATSFLYIIPVVAVLLGWVWLKEIPTALSLAGGAVALAGVVIVNRFKDY